MAGSKDKEHSTKTSPEASDGMDSDELTQDMENPELVENSEINWEQKFGETEKEFLYLRAEFENYKRNAIKERSQMMKYGAQRLAQDLLDTMDVFAQAMDGDTTADNFENFVQGIKMTHQQLRQSLEKHGIKEMDVIGKNFDPATQEALGTEPVDNYEPGQVCRVFKAPFMYHDRLLRAGQVFVAMKKENAE